MKCHLINLILKITWKNKLGTSLKYKLKKTGYNFKKIGWSINLFATHDPFFKKKWHPLFFLGWFSFGNKSNSDGFADPFLFVKSKSLFLFCESIVNGKGEIWFGAYSGNKIKSMSCVLSEPFHLSYPNIFEHEHEVYMIPESHEDNSVRLYKCSKFPFQWELDKILFSGNKFVDINFIEFESVFYWFVYDIDIKKTRLFYSDSIFSEWQEHQKGPFESNRNAGDFIKCQNQIFRPVQLSEKAYGEGFKLMKINVLNTEEYIEEEFMNPFLEKSKGFNLDGIHHISLVEFNNRTIIAVDGKNNNFYKIV